MGVSPGSAVCGVCAVTRRTPYQDCMSDGGSVFWSSRNDRGSDPHEDWPSFLPSSVPVLPVKGWLGLAHSPGPSFDGSGEGKSKQPPAYFSLAVLYSRELHWLSPKGFYWQNPHCLRSRRDERRSQWLCGPFLCSVFSLHEWDVVIFLKTRWLDNNGTSRQIHSCMTNSLQRALINGSIHS